MRSPKPGRRSTPPPKPASKDLPDYLPEYLRRCCTTCYTALDPAQAILFPNPGALYRLRAVCRRCASLELRAEAVRRQDAEDAYRIRSADLWHLERCHHCANLHSRDPKCRVQVGPEPAPLPPLRRPE